MDLKHCKLGKFEQRQKDKQTKKTKTKTKTEAKKKKTMVTEMRDPVLWKTHGKSPREGNQNALGGANSTKGSVYSEKTMGSEYGDKFTNNRHMGGSVFLF